MDEINRSPGAHDVRIQIEFLEKLHLILQK